MLNPIALQIGPISIRWYGISYIFGLAVGIWILNKLNKKRKTFKNLDQIFDFAFWLFLIGVIIGGRIGYVLFYNFSYYLNNPTKIWAIWEGGMSFHGGLIMSVIVAYIYCKKKKLDFIKVTDIAVIPGSLALMFTRLANFVNGELIGRIIENPYCKWLGLDFGDGLLRYPSQVFQSISAFLLFIILLLIFRSKPKKGILLFSYLTLYGLFRFITEFYREPDGQIGFILRYFTMGQMLSALMLLAGVIGLVLVKKGRI
jgi:phosphatidylglycerol:prolipoprotein diacylglycerol transferase